MEGLAVDVEDQFFLETRRAESQADRFEGGRAALSEDPVFDFLRTGRPVLRLLGQTREHQLVNVIGDVIFDAEFLEAFLHRDGRPAHHLYVYISRVKRRLAGHQVVQRGAQRINVVRCTRHFAIHLLRAHKQQRAAHGVFHGREADGIRHGGSDTKVAQFEAALRVDHHLRGLQIAVNRVFTMCGRQCVA